MEKLKKIIDENIDKLALTDIKETLLSIEKDKWRGY